MKASPKTDTGFELMFMHPLEIYLKYLRTINGVPLTQREVDVIACFLNMNGRSRQYVANFLSVAIRTVNAHINNITQKFGCNIEKTMMILGKSEQFLIIKEEYYLSLLVNNLFKKKLKEFKDIIVINKLHLKVILIYWDIKPHFLKNVAGDLEKAGFIVSFENRKKVSPTSHLIREDYEDSYPIYFFPDSLVEEKEIKITSKKIDLCTGSKAFFFHQEKNIKYNFEELSCITFVNTRFWRSYYFSFFELAKKISPILNLDSLCENFEESALTLRSSLSSLDPQVYSKGLFLDSFKKSGFLYRSIKNFLRELNHYILVSIFSVVILLFWILNRIYISDDHAVSQKIHFHQGEFGKKMNSLGILARSDLIVPSERTFLNRQHLISKIEESFLNQQPGIQVVALVGLGGSGKTTIARQYALSKGSPIVLEINAETRETLRGSFEIISYMLAKTNEEKQALQEVKEIKDLSEREKKISQFIKERLRSQQNWLLIYDNVKEFRDIQNNFPYDHNVWGSGRVILTTQDNHIQRNNCMQFTVFIEELNHQEKLDLFFKITKSHQAPSLLSAKEISQAKKFLISIPSFPLDVSIAAYYLKATNISYEEYLDNLKKCKIDFLEMQNNIIKEHAEYAKTRWGIISLSLEDFIYKKTDFLSLLFLTSILNNYNIPRDLLVKYKDSTTVDEFIYHMKKYSFINDELSSKSHSFSIHNNIQYTHLSYVRHKLHLKKNNHLIKEIFDTLEKYSYDIIKKEDMAEIVNLENHFHSILNYKHMIPDNLIGIIRGELGVALFFQHRYKEAIRYLSGSVSLLNEATPKIARYYGFLGNAYRELTDYKNSKLFLDKCLKVCQKFSFKEHVDLPWAYVNLGVMYNLLGDYKKAESFISRGLEIQRERPTDAPYTAWIIANLGGVYNRMGDYTRSRSLFEESLLIYKKHYGENHPKLAWVLTGLGINYRNLLDYKMSKKLFQESIAINKLNFSENSIKVALTSIELGRTYFLEGNIKMAENILRKSIIILKEHGYQDLRAPLEMLETIIKSEKKGSDTELE